MKNNFKNIVCTVSILAIVIANAYNLYNNRIIDATASIQKMISTGDTPNTQTNTGDNRGWKVNTAKKCWVVICRRAANHNDKRERRYDEEEEARKNKSKIESQPSSGWEVVECSQEAQVTLVQDCVGDVSDGCVKIMCNDL